MVILELKVIEVPAHTVVPGLAEMVIVGAACEVTLIVTPALVTVEVTAHAAFDVSTQVIWSPSVRVLVEYVALVAPLIFAPFKRH